MRAEVDMCRRRSRRKTRKVAILEPKRNRGEQNGVEGQ